MFQALHEDRESYVETKVPELMEIYDIDYWHAEQIALQYWSLGLLSENYHIEPEPDFIEEVLDLKARIEEMAPESFHPVDKSTYELYLAVLNYL